MQLEGQYFSERMVEQGYFAFLLEWQNHQKCIKCAEKWIKQVKTCNSIMHLHVKAFDKRGETQ